MQLRFQTTKHTKVRFFRSASELRAELLKNADFIFRDPGVKFSSLAGVPVRVLPKGESCKQWAELETSLLWLNELKAERSQTLAAMGGGAALDFAALTGSLYRRGMGLVLIPTTLLAMVDATLGGKTAVDRVSKEGWQKNFAGTFFPADEVWIWPGFLSSLPLALRQSGAGEVWKTLWLMGSKKSDAPLAEFVKTGKISPALTSLLRDCLKAKKNFVEKDPLDRGRIRESLNYGHTVGHALESLGKGRLAHGEAVLWGMAVESALLGKRGEKMSRQVLAKAESAGFTWPTEFSQASSSWLNFLRADKKSKGGKIELTVLSAPGKLVRIKRSPEQIAAAVKAFPEFARP